MLDTRPLLLASGFPKINRGALTTLQVNLGYKCNLSCTHCHVAAGPTRQELMSKDIIDLLLAYIDKHSIKTLDVTGGAPEMNPHFAYLVTEARKRDVTVIDRCNLTILLEPGYEDMARFMADNQVEVVASLPCYLEDNVDKQRGKGVYSKSIEALIGLNKLGYGIEGSGLNLSLVYNPGGPSLPPPQSSLELAYKKELYDRYGIRFNSLFTITNMPISRFGSVLLSKGQFDEYMALLKASYSDANLQTVMCRSLISIDWEGYVYDCDFNQMLDIPMEPGSESASKTSESLIVTDNERTHLADILDTNLTGKSIEVAGHCYGCTAGQGSSCGGALE